ncbi:glycosyltransferase family 4 protein [Actinomadura sp. WMMA1423]|uniref:glycosyltransferase family 4 protein n=1 Tax=Actinomadura sp. WMMA1423 TaxID=2591108 RepID=UPI0011466FE7|nr:glycosyltransferase family 4 protein [Actinomadura sp. WMMA1423]
MLKVNVVSESALTVGGHGVHSAYLEHVSMLRQVADVTTNVARRVDVQHAHTIGPYAKSLLMTGRRRVVTAHLTPGSVVGSLRAHRHWNAAFTRYLRAFYNGADAVLAVSPAVRDELVQMGVDQPVHVVPNTVNVAAIRARSPSSGEARERLGVPADAFVVLGVGQVQPRKGISTFVECARALPDLSFYWVGGIIFGPLADRRSEMRRLMSNVPSNVFFTGPRSRSTVFDHLAAADLFFLPSLQENCPMTVLEAAALHKPILLRDLPQYKDQYGDDCTYGDDVSFAQLIDRLRGDRDAVAQRSAGAAALGARFDSRANLQRLLDIYEAI